MSFGVEIGIFLIVVAGVAWFLAGYRIVAAVVATVAIGVAALQLWSPAQPTIPEQQAPPKSTRMGYVSSTTCRSCHPDQFQSWHDSYHRTMTQVASPDAIIAPYEDTVVEGRGRRFELEVRDGELWARDVNADALYDHVTRHPGTPPPSSLPTVEGPIVMLTGSHHMQIYWIRDERGIFQQLNWVWLREDERWVPSEDVYSQPETGQLGVGGNWALHCARCHSTGPQMRLRKPGRPIADTKIGELGIACEACHGPAVDHIEKHRNPAARYTQYLRDAGDPTIVNPAKLDHRRSAQVCGHCHSLLQAAREGDGWSLDDGWFFRPGDDLEVSQPVVTLASLKAREAPKEDLPAAPGIGQSTSASHHQIDEKVYFWPDGTTRAAGREYNSISQTGCYTRGEMDCVSCHSLHESDPNDQLAEATLGDASCLQCHAEYAGQEQIAAHTHHSPGTPGARCENCHMANTTYGLLKMMRNHQVDSPVVAGVRGGERPNACNLCHLDQTLAWTQARMRDWYDTPPGELSPEEHEVPAGLLWLVKGDSAQRQTVAWHLGWPDARAALPPGWGAPFLARTLDDPYAAVRYLAGKSLARLPGFEDFEYDYLEKPIGREIAVATARKKANPSHRGATENQALFDRLRAERDDTPILYLE